VRAEMNEIRAWGSGGIKSPREKRSTGRETCHSATLFTSNPTWTGQVLNVGLGCETLVTSAAVVTRKLGLNFGRRLGLYFSSPGRDQIGAHSASYPVGI
jgi:hypothetical protein